VVSAVAVSVVALLFVVGAQATGHRSDLGPLPVGRGVSVPPHTEVASSPPWLALVFALVADATLFVSLLFGTLYLWIAAPNWPPSATPQTSLALALGAVVILALAAAAARGSLRSQLADRKPQLWMVLAALLLVAAIAVLMQLIGGVMPLPREHALGATAAALLSYVLVHAGIGLLFLASNLWRTSAGYVSARRTLDLRLTRLWLDYTVVTAAIAIALVLALPSLVGMLGARP
jgi:cytochrome c oxidase subunit I+III